MKTQKYNQAELKDLNVKIEKEVVDTLLEMAKNTKIPLDDLVVIGLKRFISSHVDYLGRTPKED
jgi:hypothetical protein